LGQFQIASLHATEDIPDFTSTVYTYYGLDGEQAPLDTTEVIIHPSVTVIQAYAFRECQYPWCGLSRHMLSVNVNIPGAGYNVTRIEGCAFLGCHSLRSIRFFSLNLEIIGNHDFCFCKSLEGDVYLPSTVKRIDYCAFRSCESVRVFKAPESIKHIGYEVVYECDRLLTTFQYNEDDDGRILNNVEVNQWLIQRHANLPFHQACFSAVITPQ